MSVGLMVLRLDVRNVSVSSAGGLVSLVTKDRMHGFDLPTSRAEARSLNPGDAVEVVLRKVAQ